MQPDLPRRELLTTLLAAGLAPAFSRHARAADVPRFALGIASGHPHAGGMVLWTRLVGDDLPERANVSWEVAHDEGFTNIAARGVEVAEAVWAHSVHAEPAGLASARWYFYRFTALGQRSMVGRTRTAPAADAASAPLRFSITSCQRWDHGHYAAWRDVAASNLDLVLFLGDYIYEYPARPGAVRLHRGATVRTLDAYRERYAQYKSDPLLQAAHAACPWLVVWDDHEVANDYAGLEGRSARSGFARQRAAAYQAYWEHMPFPNAARPVGPDMRIYGRLDWGRLARIHLLDDRQYRDLQACPKPGRGGSNTVQLRDCPELLDPQRTLLGAAQEGWLAQGWSLDRPWNLLAQQTLMARMSLTDPAQGGSYRTDGWDGYPSARQRLLGDVAEKKVPGVVVLGGDIHANVVADLRVDFDDAKSAVIASEFCGTSISSHGPAQARIDAALGFNPHLHHARGDERGYTRFLLDETTMQAEHRVVDNVQDARSAVGAGRRFQIDAKRAGVQPG